MSFIHELSKLFFPPLLPQQHVQSFCKIGGGGELKRINWVEVPNDQFACRRVEGEERRDVFKSSGGGEDTKTDSESKWKKPTNHFLLLVTSTIWRGRRWWRKGSWRSGLLGIQLGSGTWLFCKCQRVLFKAMLKFRKSLMEIFYPPKGCVKKKKKERDGGRGKTKFQRYMFYSMELLLGNGKK